MKKKDFLKFMSEANDKICELCSSYDDRESCDGCEYARPIDVMGDEDFIITETDMGKYIFVSTRGNYAGCRYNDEFVCWIDIMNGTWVKTGECPWDIINDFFLESGWEEEKEDWEDCEVFNVC